MTKYQPQPSSSTTVSITVLSFPKPIITTVSGAPAYAKSGDALSFKLSIRNDGGTGSCWYNVADTLGGTLASGNVSIGGSGGTVFVTLNCSMPNHDTTFRFRTGYTDAFGYNVQTSSVDVVVALFVLVATALTLGLNKTNVVPEETVTASGKLTRTDTGAGLASQTVTIIEIDTSNLVSRQVGSVTTASDGTYSGSFASNVKPGTYNIQSSFAGGGTLSASVSPTAGLGIRIVSAIGTLLDLLPLVMGTGLVWYGKRR